MTTLQKAIIFARMIARTDLARAVRALQAAGVAFASACHYALHCARGARALVLNMYKEGPTRQHIAGTITTDGEAEFGVLATVYEGPNGG
jgi:hypothetical protein